MHVDKHLIKGCINGDRLSQKALYENCAPYVYSIVKNYISDQEYFKDAMQECFAHIFTSLRKYDPRKGTFKGWIARITVNQSINVLKKTGRVRFYEGLELITEIAENDGEKLYQLSKDEIELMLADMPLGYRTVFLLFVIDDYSHKEIAALLEITPETSRSQLSRATQWIRKNIANTLNNISYATL